MASNSLAELLVRMQGRPVTSGWGAVAAFSRVHLNAIMAEQFASRLTAAHLLMPFSGRFTLGESGSPVEFSSLEFGPPQLSFENVSLGSRRARLSISLVGGEFTVTRTTPGMPDVLGETSRITEGMGFTLSMDVSLAAAASETDATGRVTVSAEGAENPRCNLLPEPIAQGILGEALLKHVLKQPGFKTTFTLALADAGNYVALSPVAFDILTQPAPSGAPEDGAVLVFMKVRGWDNDAVSLPGQGSDFPYFIPDNVSGGKPLYTAALVVARPLLHLVDDTQLQTLAHHMLPPSHVFVEGQNGRHQPWDMLVVGSIERAPGHVAIEPLVTSVRHARNQQFTARRGDGTVVPGVTWSTACLNSPATAGQINAAGQFAAPTHPVVGQSVLPTQVTARFQEDGETKETSAVVWVRFEALNVAPLICSRGVGSDITQVPVHLTASSLGNGTLAWRLLGAQLGSLQVVAPGRAVYTPPASISVPLVTQRIEVRDATSGETVQCAVVLTGTQHMLSIQPPFGGAFVGRTVQTLSIDPAALERTLAEAGVPEAARRQATFSWTLDGDGSLAENDNTAVFTPPATLTSSPVSVVNCVLSVPGFTFRGYTVVEMTQRDVEVPHWQDLHDFSIEPLRGIRAYANGMQQIPIRIRVETSTFTGDDGTEWEVPASPAEMASMKLMDRASNQEIPFVAIDQEGIAHDSNVNWAVSAARNRFRPFSATVADEPPARNARTTYVDLYLHIKSVTSPEFYAVFQAKESGMWSSLDHGTSGNRTIKITGEAIPTAVPDDYRFDRERAWNGNPIGPDEDEFDYVLASVDFWRLNYLRNGIYTVGFSTLVIEANTSTIQYESELLNETFVSYTGYAFSPITHDKPPVRPAQLSFDPYLTSLVNELDHEGPSTGFHSRPPSPGQLMVSVHREQDLPYWYDAMAGERENREFRKKLDPPVIYTLRDEDGNRHELQVAFDDPSKPDSRNRLVLTSL